MSCTCQGSRCAFWQLRCNVLHDSLHHCHHDNSCAVHRYRVQLVNCSHADKAGGPCPPPQASNANWSTLPSDNGNQCCCPPQPPLPLADRATATTPCRYGHAHLWTPYLCHGAVAIRRAGPSLLQLVLQLHRLGNCAGQHAAPGSAWLSAATAQANPVLLRLQRCCCGAGVGIDTLLRCAGRLVLKRRCGLRPAHPASTKHATASPVQRHPTAQSAPRARVLMSSATSVKRQPLHCLVARSG